MTTSYTSLLGLALPVTGELSGTWGDTVNNYITNYLDSSIAGAQVISGSSTAVTLSKTTGSSLSQVGSGSSGSSQYQIIRCTGSPASLLTITAPATDKTYVVINATSTSRSVKIVGAGPTTGVTILSGKTSIVAWNGSDFVEITPAVATNLAPASTAGYVYTSNGGSTPPSFQSLSVTGYLPTTGGTMTGNIAFNSTQFGTNVDTFLSTPSSANLAAALTDETGTGVNVFNNTPTLIAPILGTPTSGDLSNCTFPTLNQNTTGTATTATNLASGSAGTIPYQSASGTTAMLAAGTSGQVLTSSGAGAPTWGTPSSASGALVFLSTVTASSSATVDIETTFNATYDEYVLKVTNLYTTTDSVNLMVRMKIGGSYLTTATYRSSIDPGTLLNEIRLFSGNYLRNNRPTSFNVNIHSPASTSNEKTIDVFGVCRATSEAEIISSGGWNTTTASAMTGIQFYASSGTILSGTFRLYGVSKS